ncbi:MAG: START domain-containing protein [Pseudomonadota bacterium]
MTSLTAFRPFAALLAFLLTFTVSAAAADPAGETWRLVSDKNGIKVYMRHADDARIKTFRGVTRFSVDSLHALSAVLNDTPNMPRWMHFVSQTKEISRTDYLNRKYQFLTSLPWPLADREALVQLLVRQDPATKAVTVHVVNDANMLPLDDEYVRIPQMQGRFAFSPTGNGHEVEVTYELIMDPGGYIPAWIANIVLKDIPYFTLEKLRRVVERPEYKPWREKHLELPW